MKKVAPLLVLALIGYFVYNLAGEASDPHYMRYEVLMTAGSREATMTAIEKLRPGLSCADREQRRSGFVKRLEKGCGDCKLTSSTCKETLTPLEQMLFDDEVTDRPYISYEKGGIFPDQDFRILFPDLSDTELGFVCVEMSKRLRRTALFFVAGKTECVRPSEE